MPNLRAQCDCAYPIIFVHGWTGDATSFQPLYTDANFISAWGGLSDTHDFVLNATTQSNAFGSDNTKYTADDDVLIQFVNDPNILAPGCVYAVDFDWFWDQNPGAPSINMSSVPSGESDSNQSSIEKQGWAVGEAIKAVLAANPTKKKVILAGHSMGGLASREYLQRFEGGQYTWWVDPSDPVDGHKVAKLVTLGTPHRGSNAGLANLGSIFGFDERSESVRDLRFSYACGFLNLSRCRAPYLFGGPEDDNVDNGYFKSADVDCDGDYDTNPITSINRVGAPDPWDGTDDNPAMPLPSNVKYAYYTSYSAQDITLLQFNGGDGVVADERQWIYNGGDGSTTDFQSGASIPAPNDGTDYRLSDRVHSADNVFHTSQTGDLDDVMRVLDEADYPFFAYDVDQSVDYSGHASQRADFVPANSEYTGTADNTIDGDWYKFEITANTPGFDIAVTPHPALAGRVDFYGAFPGPYGNANSTESVSWSSGAGAQMLSTASGCLAPGIYYLRITHENTTASSWQTPYKFRIDPQPCAAPIALAASTTALTTNLTWAASPCATQYTIRYREVGMTGWTLTTTVTTNSYTATALLPDVDYEYQVSADCGSGATPFAPVFPFTTVKCPVNLYIPSLASLAFVPTGVYNVDQMITSDGFIDPSTNVTYYAGQSIELMSGFETGNGVFLADIKTCVPSPIWSGDVSNLTTNSDDDLMHIEKLEDQDDPKKVKNQELAEYVRLVPQADGNWRLEYKLKKSTQVHATLHSQYGVSMKTIIENEAAKSGLSSTMIDVNALKPGKYLVQFKAGKLHRTLKIVKRPDEAIRSRN